MTIFHRKRFKILPSEISTLVSQWPHAHLWYVLLCFVFDSGSFSVGHLSRNCRSSSAKTFRNPFCERSLKSDHRSGECGSNKNALQSGRVGSSCNAIAGENQSETADIMCKQEALLLGPLVGQSVSQSLGGSDDLKSPSQLQLSRLLHSQMQCSSSLVKAARDNYPSI